MIVIPSSNKVHPLVVAGLGRSGTRFVTNLLNAHQHVTLQGEIPNGVFGEIKQLFHLLDRHYGNGRNRPENPRRQKEIWEAKKREMVFAVWAFGGQDPIVRMKPRTRYFGYKRPGHEEYFEFYSRIFAPVECRYVFCFRNFEDYYLSIKSRWPTRRLEDIASVYCQAANRYVELQQKTKGRIALFCLDDAVAGGFEYVKRNLLDVLDLGANEKMIEKVLNNKPDNSTVSHGKERRRRLDDAEQEYFLKEGDRLKAAFETVRSYPPA